jgi:pyrroline-5-carboxylate reductase
MERDLTPDWILQETLTLQQKVLSDFLASKAAVDKPLHSSKPDEDGGLTITILGCGAMGTAIMRGILHSVSPTVRSDDSKVALANQGQSDAAHGRVPTKFNVCVRKSKSAEKVREALGQDLLPQQVRICIDRNVEAVEQADIVLLCCQAEELEDILRPESLVNALSGKLLISVCTGVTERHLASLTSRSRDIAIVCAMPNAAAAVRESMTVISEPSSPLSPDHDRLVNWIFSRIGNVRRVPSENMDVCTALCAGGPAFAALMIESMAAGAVGMGLSRDDAYTMAAQTVRGTTTLLLEGEHPSVLRDMVATPGGPTTYGLNVLEESGLRGVIAKSIREAAMATERLRKAR